LTVLFASQQNFSLFFCALSRTPIPPWVRVTVHADGAAIVRKWHGSGEGRGPPPAEVQDIVLKAAETDATKRALATSASR
jgi:hypothetical protein